MAFAPSRPALQIKAPVRFPALVLAAAGVAVSKLNGVFSFGLDFPSLVDNAGIADPSQYTTAVYNKVLGRYEEVRLDGQPHHARDDAMGWTARPGAPLRLCA